MLQSIKQISGIGIQNLFGSRYLAGGLRSLTLHWLSVYKRVLCVRIHCRCLQLFLFNGYRYLPQIYKTPFYSRLQVCFEVKGTCLIKCGYVYNTSNLN